MSLEKTAFTPECADRREPRDCGVMETFWKLKWWLLHNFVIIVKVTKLHTSQTKMRMISSKNQLQCHSKALSSFPNWPTLQTLKAIVTFQEHSSKVSGHHHSQLQEAGQTSVVQNTPDQAPSQEQSAVCTSSASALGCSAQTL